MERNTKIALGVGVALALYTFSKPGALTVSAKHVGDVNLLNPAAREKVLALIQRMDQLGIPFKVFETLRTTARQQALYAQGRTAPGAIVTHVDGVTKKSKHQSGNAADLVLDVARWPASLGPKPTNPWDVGVEKGVVVRPQVLNAWHVMGREATALGLRWLGGPEGGARDPLTGLAFDAPHVEFVG